MMLFKIDIANPSQNQYDILVYYTALNGQYEEWPISDHSEAYWEPTPNFRG